MLKQEKHQKTKETGITLMVLVITIIILLILAGKSDKAIIGTIPTNDALTSIMTLPFYRRQLLCSKRDGPTRAI